MGGQPEILSPGLLKEVYQALFRRWGPQGWWPGQSRLEIAVGAILTQNTAWRNVEKAIERLTERGLLDPEAMHCASKGELADAVRPAGYFNVKAARLKNFISYLRKEHSGEMALMTRLDASALRADLLGVNGIGPETADSILLYALGYPKFVVDAYTRRFLSRHAWIDGEEKYDDLASLFTHNMPVDVGVYKEFHALIVRLGKEHCRGKARCEGCPLRRYLPPAPRSRSARPH